MGNISSLREINIKNNFLEIGATVTMTQIAGSPVIPDNFYALKKAASEMGSQQIRNRATIGGNIAGASPAADLIPILFLFKAKASILNSKGKQYQKDVSDLILGTDKIDLDYDRRS